jgi:glycerol-3-phosphate acyltransferase PlsY
VTGALVAILGYFCGSFPSALVLTLRATGTDIRAQGSGNPGAANVARSAGFKWGAFVALADILKGAIPVWIGIALHLSHTWLAVVAVSAVAGHDFSIFLRGKGGKGVATTFGVGLALAPFAAVAAIVVWVGVMVASRYASLASLSALVVFPIAIWITGAPPTYVWAGVALLLLGLAKHWHNVGRLVQGNERKFVRAHPASGG